MLSIIYILIFGLLFLFVYNIIFPSKEGLSNNTRPPPFCTSNCGRIIQIYEDGSLKTKKEEAEKKTNEWLEKGITIPGIEISDGFDSNNQPISKKYPGVKINKNDIYNNLYLIKMQSQMNSRLKRANNIIKNIK